MDHPTEVGDWKQISILGSGAFGTVMLWRNEKNSECIAIKKCKFHKPNALTPKQKQRWNMEVDFLRSVNHRNIISYKQIDPDLELLINKYNPTKLSLLTMEYCKKGNLRRYLTNEPIRLCGLPEHHIRCILEDISNGLNYLHQRNIAHRDIKPDNIVLQHCDNRKGETVYKIIDLGYAKELQDSTLSFVGTLHYLAPEIFFNQNYNNRVDYWSMGTMVFELICGVLPFLPDLTPFEKYQKIKDKGPDDICIYTSNSGAITNSSEIKKEHFITSCFKYNIENWLKRVLQINPANRVFSNNMDALEYLRFILDIKIIQVFAAYKQDFYSYEILNCTLLGTLKEWVARDLKIPKNELLYIFRSQEKNKIWFCNDDNTLLEYLVCNDDVVLYVYKKDSIFSSAVSTKLPGLLKELFNVNANLQMISGRNIYRQALFFVHSELRIGTEFKTAYMSLIQHIEDLCEKVKSKYASAKTEFSGVLAKAERFFQKKKNITKDKLNGNCFEVGKCLKYCEQLLSNIERRQGDLKEFGKQCKLSDVRKAEIQRGRDEVEKVFGKCDIQSRFNTINGKLFLDKKKGEPQDIIYKRIKDVISDTLRLKCNLFSKEKLLKEFSADLCLILKWTEQLLIWSDNFISILQKLSADFVSIEETFDKIVLQAIKTKTLNSTLDFNLATSETIIRQNESLRHQVETLMSESISNQETLIMESGAYFDLN